MTPEEFKGRAKIFAVAIIKAVGALPKSPTGTVLGGLSARSACANSNPQSAIANPK